MQPLVRLTWYPYVWHPAWRARSQVPCGRSINHAGQTVRVVCRNLSVPSRLCFYQFGIFSAAGILQLCKRTSLLSIYRLHLSKLRFDL